ncbi:hypothetical protein Tco_0756772 [Tanacetum coccineum]
MDNKDLSTAAKEKGRVAHSSGGKCPQEAEEGRSVRGSGNLHIRMQSNDNGWGAETRKERSKGLRSGGDGSGLYGEIVEGVELLGRDAGDCFEYRWKVGRWLKARNGEHPLEHPSTQTHEFAIAGVVWEEGPAFQQRTAELTSNECRLVAMGRSNVRFTWRVLVGSGCLEDSFARGGGGRSVIGVQYTLNIELGTNNVEQGSRVCVVGLGGSLGTRSPALGENCVNGVAHIIGEVAWGESLWTSRILGGVEWGYLCLRGSVGSARQFREVYFWGTLEMTSGVNWVLIGTLVMLWVAAEVVFGMVFLMMVGDQIARTGEVYGVLLDVVVSRGDWREGVAGDVWATGVGARTRLAGSILNVLGGVIWGHGACGLGCVYGEVFGKQWDMVNAIVLGWILNSISEELFLGQIFSKRAKHVWEELKETYDKYDAMIELPKCVCNASEGFKKHNQLLKLMQFLMGLDDSYMQIRSSILSREVLPDVRSAYATISSEESHRVAVGSIAGSFQRNQASAFVSNMPNSQNFQRRANQHMTYTDKELDNVLGISHLRIKVGHPNGTEAYISKIGNIRLSNGLSLYDVMVIHEYCVTLISVHKLAKENKVIVAFDENRCYFLNQDLNQKNVMGIGDQCEGLYYYNNQGIKSNNSNLRFQCLLFQHDWHCRLGHPVEPVLNVLKESLQIDKKDNIGYFKVCQRAKQTREPFSLSDYTSKSLGDLVHLDLWGPYKVTSYEGFRILRLKKNDSANVFQDVNHINFFDIKYPEIPNDDERVANDLNKGKSDSSSSSVSGSNINTVDFLVDYGNDDDSSDELVATQNEEVATLEENIFSEGNLDQNPSSSHDVQNVRREPKTYFEASKYSHWTDAMNQEMDALLRNGTWELVDVGSLNTSLHRIKHEIRTRKEKGGELF